MIKQFILLLSFSIIAALSVSAQSWASEHVMTVDSTTVLQVDHTVEDMAWLSGYWLGEGLGGHVEELWSKPKKGKMVSAFRYDNGTDLVFTEHVTMTNTDNALSMLVKHFSADFTGWEESADYIEFPLIKIEGSKAYFDGCTIVRTDDHLGIYVMIEQDGVVTEELFSYDLTEL